MISPLPDATRAEFPASCTGYLTQSTHKERACPSAGVVYNPGEYDLATSDEPQSTAPTRADYVWPCSVMHIRGVSDVGLDGRATATDGGLDG